MTTPHANWAQYYDFAYENTYGDVYRGLTDAALEQVRVMGSPCRGVADVGAGTGRLAIPLAQMGYQVTAVDSRQKVLGILRSKAEKANVCMETSCCTTQSFAAVRKDALPTGLIFLWGRPILGRPVDYQMSTWLCRPIGVKE